MTSAIASSVMLSAATGSATDKGEAKENLFGCADERTIWTRIWQGVAGASIVINLAAMITEGSAVAILAGIVACIVAPIVIYLQFQLQNTDSK